MYKVKSNLKHNGQLYTKGEEIELDAKEAKVLIADGVLYAKGEEVESEEVEQESDKPLTKAQKEAQRQAKKNKEAHDKAMAEVEDGAGQDDENGDDKKGPVDDGLEKLTKAELMDIVEKEAIEEITDKMVKDDIVEAIRVARAANADNDDEL